VAQTLLERGWTNVRPLVGGFDAWRAAGYPTETKPTRTQTPKEVAANIAKAEGNEGDEVIE
jgi:3-mercaptopyruvate sulfurtransferase SseA